MLIQVPFDTYPAELSVIRNNCSTQLCDYSRKLIFAGSGDQFEALWDEMIEMLNGYDYEKLYELDTADYQKEVDAKEAAKAAVGK